MDANYIMQLKIKNMEASDSGVYYCNAQNNFGSFAQVLKLQTRQKSVSSFLAYIENNCFRILCKISHVLLNSSQRRMLFSAAWNKM